MKKQFFKGLTFAVALLAAAGASAQEAAYYSTDFKASKPEDIGFLAVDANNDGTKWVTQTSTNNFRNLDGVGITEVAYSPATIANADNNDWLISPSIRFEAGKTYEVKMLMCKFAYAAIEDAFEVMLGDEKDAESMTTTLIARQDGDLPQFPGNSLWTKNFTLTVPSTGDYYIGIHAIGKPGQKIGVASLSIAKGIALITPAAVSDLTLTPDPTADKRVTLSFTAPTVAKDGTTLTELTKVEIKRNGELAATLTDVAPGKALSYEDMVAVSGIYTYTVQAFTAAGGGDLATAETFVGLNTPAAVSNVTAANAGSRTAVINWEAPTLDKDGYPISASVLSYDVYRKPIYESTNVKVASKLKALTFTEVLPDTVVPDTVNFFIYSVVARTAEGQATATSALPVPLGKPYAAPYTESFYNGRVHSIFTSNPIKGNNYWYIVTSLDDVSSADADNGLVFLSGMIGGAAKYSSGLIDLAGMASPTLSYYTYNITNCDPADNELEVVVTATDGTTKSFGKYIPAMGWKKLILPLDDFVGKVIKIDFNGYRNNNTDLCLDCIAVSNIFRHDLKLAAINVPAKVRSSEPFDIMVDVLNFGSEDSGAYTVELYCNDALVDTYQGDKLAVGAYDHVAFTRTHGILDGETASYKAKVVYAADQDNANNESNPVATTIRVNSYPTVTDLTGTVNGGTVSLTWGEPDTDKAQPYETLDTFEQYESWANKNVGDWIFEDRDNGVIAGFNVDGADLPMPGIPSYSSQSWWVFDSSHENFNNGSLATISGTKFLASMVTGIVGQGFVQNDDWAISPELYGGPQTITVNARSAMIGGTDLETFELLYSTGSVNPDDFISLITIAEVPSEFTAYEFDLPDGARRFAIRNIGLNKYVLMVDDVTYIPVGDPAAFSINGYNIYRDGMLLNEQPVEENEYEDLTAGSEVHTYNVTVLYSAGESQFGNSYKSDNSGVESVIVDAAEARYYNMQGMPVARPEVGKPYIRVVGDKAGKVVVR